jgi:hypothetical protein
MVYRIASRALETLEKALENQMSLEELQDLLAETEASVAPEHASEEERIAAAWVFRAIRADLRSDPREQLTLVERLAPALEWLAPLLVRLRTSKPSLTGAEPLGHPPLCKDVTRPAKEL